MSAVDLDAVRLRVARIAANGRAAALLDVGTAFSATMRRLDALAEDLEKGLLSADEEGASAPSPETATEPAPETQPESLGQMIKREAAEHQGGAA